MLNINLTRMAVIFNKVHLKIKKNAIINGEIIFNKILKQFYEIKYLK